MFTKHIGPKKCQTIPVSQCTFSLESFPSSRASQKSKLSENIIWSRSKNRRVNWQLYSATATKKATRIDWYPTNTYYISEPDLALYIPYMQLVSTIGGPSHTYISMDDQNFTNGRRHLQDVLKYVVPNILKTSSRCLRQDILNIFVFYIFKTSSTRLEICGTVTFRRRLGDALFTFCSRCLVTPSPYN